MARSLLPASVLDETAAVYTEDASGAFNVLARADLACRLGHVSARGASGAVERAELVATRRLVWPADYVMPERCQIEIDGQRWNPVHGSFAAPTVAGRVAYRACDVVRGE